jgi:hypothetical protein
MGLLGRLVRRTDQRWCAPKFAQRLGPRLLRDYGASRFYTAGQIRAACAKCNLPRRHLALAYAGFLPPDEFEATAGAAAQSDDYSALRALFFRFARGGGDLSFAPAAMNAHVDQALHLMSGKDGGHGGSDGGPD